MKPLVVCCGGGVGRELLDTIESINNASKKWDLLGFYDDDFKVKIPGCRRLGKIEDLNLVKQELNVIVALSDVQIKERIIRLVSNPNVSFINVIHPTTLVSKTSKIGFNNYIGPYSIIGPNVTIGNHIYIGGLTNIGHDSTIQDYVSIMPGCMISGRVSIYKKSFLGTGAKILQNIQLNECNTVGAGAVVTRSTSKHDIVVGIPAKTRS